MAENSLYSTGADYDLITNTMHKMSPPGSYLVGDMTVPSCFRFSTNENESASLNSNNNNNNNNNFYSFQCSSTPHYYNSHHHNNSVTQNNYGNITIHNNSCISTHLHQV